MRALQDSHHFDAKLFMEFTGDIDQAGLLEDWIEAIRKALQLGQNTADRNLGRGGLEGAKWCAFKNTH